MANLAVTEEEEGERGEQSDDALLENAIQGGGGEDREVGETGETDESLVSTVVLDPSGGLNQMLMGSTQECDSEGEFGAQATADEVNEGPGLQIRASSSEEHFRSGSAGEDTDALVPEEYADSDTSTSGSVRLMLLSQITSNMLHTNKFVTNTLM